MPAGVSSQRCLLEGVIHEDLCPFAYGNLGHQNNVVPNIHKVRITLKCWICKSSNLMATTVIFITSNCCWLRVQAAANVMIVTNMAIALHHDGIDYFITSRFV